MSADKQHEHSNIVNIHDPFFLWGLLQHSDDALIGAISKVNEDDLSRLYWSCLFRERSDVCDAILKSSQTIRTAHDAVEKLSRLAEKAQSDEPDLSDIQTPFPLPTSPDFIVTKISDASYIPSKGKPLKFTVMNDRGDKKE